MRLLRDAISGEVVGFEAEAGEEADVADFWDEYEKEKEAAYAAVKGASMAGKIGGQSVNLGVPPPGSMAYPNANMMMDYMRALQEQVAKGNVLPSPPLQSLAEHAEAAKPPVAAKPKRRKKEPPAEPVIDPGAWCDGVDRE